MHKFIYCPYIVWNSSLRPNFKKIGFVDFRILYWKIELRTKHFWKIKLNYVLKNRLLKKVFQQLVVKLLIEKLNYHTTALLSFLRKLSHINISTKNLANSVSQLVFEISQPNFWKSCLILTLKVVNGFVHPTISHHIIMFWCKRKNSIKKIPHITNPRN